MATTALLAALLIVIAGCAPNPVPPTTLVIASATPVAQTPAPSSSLATVDAASVELHYLDARYVPADAPVSADGQLLWTAGENGPSEIWRYVPGAAEPERLFASPRQDGAITAVAGSRAGYAFAEESPRAFGEGGWRLWFLAAPGREPVEIDRGSAPGAGVAPTLAMDGEHVAWAAFDEPPAGPVSRLRLAAIASLPAVSTLIEAPIAERKLWYPALSGQELWYATIEPDPAGVRDEFHIEHLDLAEPQAPATVFRGPGHDFNPAVNARFVVWKTTDPGDAALNWGALRLLDRGTDAVRTIPVARANRPSIGDRFIAFDEVTHARLEVYDLATRRVVELGRSESAPAYGGISLSGSLLAFFTQDGGGQPRIGWAVLPG
ncbi:MAG TPA: hypothetical protein VL749_01395 [Patescibacteria group bacterium]|nr:hypothetical protein [Patescibacteria group bacterium]